MNPIDELLPKEISDEIYFMRDSAAAITIQRLWFKTHAPKVVAKMLCGNMCNEPDLLSVMDSDTAAILAYTARVLTGKEKQHAWLVDVLAYVAQKLYEDTYSGGPGAKYYIQCENSYIALNKKCEFSQNEKWLLRCERRGLL